MKGRGRFKWTSISGNSQSMDSLPRPGRSTEEALVPSVSQRTLSASPDKKKILEDLVKILKKPDVPTTAVDRIIHSLLGIQRLSAGQDPQPHLAPPQELLSLHLQ